MPGTRKSGRHAKPTALKALQGGRMRPHNRHEPRYGGEPVCPEHISSRPELKAKWDELVARMAHARVLTDAHGEALAVLVATWVDYERDYATWARLNYPPIIIDQATQRARIHPMARRVEELRNSLIRRLGEFGGTPVMGPKVQGGGQESDADPFESFLIRGKARGA